MKNFNSTRNHRILVIDDNRAVHDDFRKILNCAKRPNNDLADLEAALFATRSPSTSGIHFEIDSAFQGEEGLALVKRAVEAGEPYEIAFVDVRSVTRGCYTFRIERI